MSAFRYWQFDNPITFDERVQAKNQLFRTIAIEMALFSLAGENIPPLAKLRFGGYYIRLAGDPAGVIGLK
jgi:hypothetical protein